MTAIGTDGTITNDWRPDDPSVVDALRGAAIGDLHRIYDSSNHAFLAELADPRLGPGLGVYKPGRGERPLWDFPEHLYRREIAAYEFDRLLGWKLVPPTVLVEGPHGPGALQLFIEHDPSEHYFALRDRGGYDDQLARFAAFDLLANNADRKGGHLLLDAGGHVWGIDHGLCFHREPKVRTVIWDYAGSPLPQAWLQDVRRVAGGLVDGEVAGPLRDCLTRGEVSALARRCAELIARPELPAMFAYRCVPWPMI